MCKHLRFYRSFFSLFHFSQFSQKKSFCHFYPQTTIPPALLQIVFFTFSLFPPKNPFCQFYPSFCRSFFSLFHFSQNSYTFYWFENFHELWAKNLSFHIRHKNCYKLICVPHLKLWNLPNYKSWIWYEMTCFLMFL